jgi:hypothetical protein
MSLFRRTNPKGSDDLDRVRAELARLTTALEDHGHRTGRVEASLAAAAAPEAAGDLVRRLDALVTQMRDLDARVSAVARELANQIGELGQEIDALHRRGDPEPLDDGSLEELRDSQTRLANEQARYQIAVGSLNRHGRR